MNTQKGLSPIVWVIIVAVVLGGGYVAFRMVNFINTVEQSADAARLQVQNTKILANIGSYQTALDLYKTQYGYYPDKLERVFEARILQHTIVFDEIQSAIDYSSRNKGSDYIIQVQLPDGTLKEFSPGRRP